MRKRCEGVSPYTPLPGPRTTLNAKSFVVLFLPLTESMSPSALSAVRLSPSKGTSRHWVQSIVTPLGANSSFLTRISWRNSRMLPLSGQRDSKNFVRSSVISHRSFTAVFEQTRISVESGIFWVSNDFADRSFFSH